MANHALRPSLRRTCLLCCVILRMQLGPEKSAVSGLNATTFSGKIGAEVGAA